MVRLPTEPPVSVAERVVLQLRDSFALPPPIFVHMDQFVQMLMDLLPIPSIVRVGQQVVPQLQDTFVRPPAVFVQDHCVPLRTVLH